VEPVVGPRANFQGELASLVCRSACARLGVDLRFAPGPAAPASTQWCPPSIPRLKNVALSCGIAIMWHPALRSRGKIYATHLARPARRAEAGIWLQGCWSLPDNQPPLPRSNTTMWTKPGHASCALMVL
jgi:hypothetical protein